ncbi:MAG: aldo/keto reductase [Thermoguttaceae bacterium]|nr:aldo/keto reductase [Thermoguttaceae bacterium]
MTTGQSNRFSRRTFHSGAGKTFFALAAPAVTAGLWARNRALAAVDEPLPRRVLGRTGIELTTMTLGTAPCGLSPQIPVDEIGRIVLRAIELGINSVDTAPAYVKSEEAIGKVLGPHRKDVFLATKVFAKTVEEAEKTLTRSFRLLRTDYLDLVYYHSVGDYEPEAALAENGVFPWLVKQKQAGKFRFLGISGHHRPGRFIPYLETGEVDVLLTVVNFVDRHTYNFEEKVLPLARKQNVGIVAMKVFGGARRSAGSYQNPKCPPELDTQYLESAIRYALGIPGVATLNLGAHNSQQVEENVRMVKSYRPLSPEEEKELLALGKKLAESWGEHFGPVTS